MNIVFQKLCYLLLNGDKEEIELLKKQTNKEKLNYKKIENEAIKYIKEINKICKKIGYKTDFDSYTKLLDNYINIKDKLTDKTKKEQLKALAMLSEIYEINLREELNKYISPLLEENIINKDKIFNKFCLYSINNNDIELYNEIQELTKLNNLNFKQYQTDSLEYVEKIKKESNKIGYSIDQESFYIILNDYLKNKKDFSDEKKANYLKILLPLSYIYNINLREKLLKPIITDSSSITYNNPIDNKELLITLINQRYYECSFNIDSLIIPSSKIIEEKEYNPINEQIELLYNLILIYLDKINNYAKDDIKEIYHINNEELINKLNTITKEELLEIITTSKNDELTKFINILYETINYDKEYIGNKDNNIFKIKEDNNTLCIYINTPSSKERYEFINKYIKKCIEEDISYKLIANKYNYKNKTLLFANKEDINTKINILNKIKEENPNIIEKFGTPLEIASTINNSYYSISTIGIKNEDNYFIEDFITYFEQIAEISYYRVLSKIILPKLNNPNEVKIINSFIELKNVELNYNNILNKGKYDEVEFNEIKDIVNKNIPEIMNTLRIYIETKEQQEILIEEFKKSIQYISNIYNSYPKKENNNIAIPKEYL